MANVIATGEVCIDCVQVIANDEGTDGHRQAMAAWLDGTPGALVVACDGEDEHVTFSATQCDGCGSRLAGDRCPVAWLDY